MLDIHTALIKASSTSCGHGNNTLPMIKQCILTLGPYILALINKSLNTVALLPKLFKLTERIVQQQLMEFIEANKLLSSPQS